MTLIIGQRVRHRPSQMGHQMASVAQGIVLWLNPPDCPGVTGTVIDILYGDLVVFRPDDWPWPIGIYSHGFMADVSCFEGIPVAISVMPGRYTTPLGLSVSTETVRAAVHAYMQHSKADEKASQL